jgi:hypothetical protein
MNGILYEEDYIGLFLLVTVAMGGGAAWLAGRAIAATWRPWWHVAFYMLILGLAVRFIHFALFEGTLLSPQFYAVDTLVCLIFGFLGFRATRVAQMTTQYGWINGRAGFLRWARRDAIAEKAVIRGDFPGVWRFNRARGRRVGCSPDRLLTFIKGRSV